MSGLLIRRAEINGRTAAAATRDLAPAERVTPRQALDGLLSPLDDPGGVPRRITGGAPADLCLLHVPLAEAMSAPARSPSPSSAGASSSDLRIRRRQGDS
jgi:hypothetical protein